MSCIQLSATESTLTFDLDCFLQGDHSSNVVTASTVDPLLHCGLQLRGLGLDAQYVENVLQEIDGYPKQYINALHSICFQHAMAMTLPQKKDFVDCLLNVSFVKTNTLLEYNDVFLYFLPIDRIKILHFANSTDNKILRIMCQFVLKNGVKFTPTAPSFALQPAFIPPQHNFFYDIHVPYNLGLLELLTAIQAKDIHYFDDWTQKLSDFCFGPPITRLVTYKMLPTIMQLGSNRPIEATEENVHIFKQALRAEHALFGTGSSILSSIAFQYFNTASEVFNFLQPISRTPSELRRLNNEFKYFSMLDQEYLNHFKDVVRASSLRHQMKVFLSILYLLKKELWHSLADLLRRYTNYFQYVPQGSLYAALHTLLQDGEDISAEILETELIYLYDVHFHRIDLNTLNQYQNLIFSRLHNHPFFQDTMQIHNYYNQCLLFEGKPMQLSRAILSVINRENSLKQKIYYNRSFIKNTLKSMVTNDQTIEPFLHSVSQIRGGNDLLTAVFYFLYTGNNSNENLQFWIQSLISESENAFTNQNERSCNQGIFERMFTALRYINHGNDQLNTIFAHGEKLIMIQSKLQNFNGDWAQKAYEFGLRSDSSLRSVREKFNHILSDYLEIGHDSSIIGLNQSVKVIYETVLDHCVENIFPDIQAALECYAHLEILS
ncbi:MAG TPA: hypothetical protein DIC42_00370 [Holosporales bacterium]|nr:hypothetical protein [Holosporales bacterium]